MLAPGARTALSAGQSSRLERALAAPDRPPRDQLYLSELRAGSRQPQSRSRTLLPLQKDVEIIGQWTRSGVGVGGGMSEYRAGTQDVIPRYDERLGGK